MKKLFLLAAIILAALTAPAAAQSNCPYIAYGVTLTAGQWNACFAAKQDAATASIPGGVTGAVQFNKSGTPAGTTGALSNGLGISFTASSTIGALNVAPTAAPSAPNNGDVWSTSAGFFGQVNGAAVGPFISSSLRTVASGSTDSITSADANGTVYWNSSSSSAKTETLPTCNPAANGFTVSVKDGNGTAGTYPITVAGAQPLDGQTTYVMAFDYQASTFQCAGAENKWAIR
jgi:VCBS repeat-containing protein